MPGLHSTYRLTAYPVENTSCRKFAEVKQFGGCIYQFIHTVRMCNRLGWHNEIKDSEHVPKHPP